MRVGVDVRVVEEHLGSGLANYTYETFRRILKEDVQNNYVLYNPNKKEYKQVVKKNSLLRLGRDENFWANMYTNDWDRKKVDVDVFHNTVNGIGLPRQKYKKLCLTIHDLIPYIYPETCDVKHLDYVLKKTPYIVEKADLIFTVSEHSKQDIMRYFNVKEEKIVVTYLGVDDKYHKMEKNYAKEVIRLKYGIESDFILYAGGFSPRKNIYMLIEAFEKARDKLTRDYKLVILGKMGRSYERLEQLVREHQIEKNILFTGLVSDEAMPYFYNAASLFTYPSLYEGFGLPPLEAMSCSTPVISSNSSSIPEILRDAAVLISPQDVEELSSKMVEVLEDEGLKLSLVEKGIVRAKEYSWEKTVQGMLKGYQTLQKG